VPGGGLGSPLRPEPPLALEGGGRLVALVTGGVHGLGRAVCRELARSGWDVAVNYRESEDDARALCAELEAMGVRARAVGADLADPAQAEALVARVEEAWGRLDALVCAAGPFRPRRVAIAAADRGAAAWREMAAANVAGTVAAVAAALPGMRRRHFGRIVTFGMDGVGRAAPWPGRAAYAAAKAALWSYTQSLAREEAPHGITANMVAPGNIVDPFKEGSIAQARRAPPEARRAPVGRPGSGEDVARVVRFLLHPDSDYLTGNLVYVGGGEDVVGRPAAWPDGGSADA
jgi:3-oxoacyl-[acyl-carrier protein] reductase